MPDHGHALIWAGHPLGIAPVIHDVKKVWARRRHERRGPGGPLWQHPFWDRFVRSAEPVTLIFRRRLFRCGRLS